MQLRHPRASLACAAVVAGLAVAPVAHADDWRYSFTPYIWLAGIDGKFSINGTLPPVEVKQDFGDIFDTTQFALAGKFEGANGRIHLFGDLIYADVGNAGVVNGTLLSAADVGSESFLGTAGAGYRLYEDYGTYFDVIAGIRYTYTKTDITVNFTAGGSASGREEENWGDAFVGVRGGYQFAQRWAVSGYGDIGAGWSDYTWQTYVGIDYQWNEWLKLSGGYRYYRDDYDNDGYSYNISQSGPLASVTLDF
jgi:hypothetical protein